MPPFLRRACVRTALFFLFLAQGPWVSADMPCPADLKVSSEECVKWRQTVLPEKLPKSRGNLHADDVNAATLGFKMFFDARFSHGPEAINCAACHQPDRAFVDRKTVSVGMSAVLRNAPTLLNSARFTSWHFWDGRADSLWSQPLITMETPEEMNFTRLEAAHLIYKVYRPRYEKSFGPLPELSNLKRFPAIGKPGDPAFDSMKPEDQEAINRVYANMGKSFEAYVRRASAGKSKVDRYLLGEQVSLSQEARKGMAVFSKARCLNCHSGPLYSDEKFHDIGVPQWPGTALDPGRSKGRAVLERSMFNAKSGFFDRIEGKPEAYLIEADAPALAGAFLTPSLRNIMLTAPYCHNGRFKTLEETVDFHLAGGGRSDPKHLYAGEVDPLLKAVPLSKEEKSELIEFLKALNGDPPRAPWGIWPGL
jgi:cytochrome c peroxidase